MNISLRQLRVFQVVARSGNFTKAGLQVGLTQPAVSRCMRELEQQLGLRLLDRTTREVTLTAAGRSLATRLDRTLDELDAVLLDVRGLASQQEGRVRVASSPTLSANLLPGCIARCQAQHPGLDLVVLDRIQEYALGSVLSGEVDFGVVIEPGQVEDLHLEPILTEPFELVCAPSHRFARRRKLAWSDLADEPLVLLDRASGSRRLIDEALARYHVPVKLSQEVGHVTTIFRMVDAGLGISVVPHLAIPPAGLQGLIALPLLPRVERRVMLARRSRYTLSPQAEIVWRLVRDAATGAQGAVHAPSRMGPSR